MPLSFRFVQERTQVKVPSWVSDLESFRRWADADDFPEEGSICYLKGEVSIDMTKEQIFTHALVKAEFTGVLRPLAKAASLGVFLVDGPRFSNEEAGLSCVPDGLFISNASRQSGKVRITEGMEVGYLEITGSPDMVLEVVSDSSVQKDLVILRQAYWEAGVDEYWIVDARAEPLSFAVLKRGSRGYVAARRSEGWIRSAVFGKSFQLTQSADALGQPDYTLSVR